MDIVLDYKKNIEQNASVYFEKAKKAKAKAEGAREAIEKMETKLVKLEKDGEKLESQLKEAVKPPRKKAWYEKFRWFISSEGFLVVGGRDATSNEIVVKKHTDKEDLVFHTDMAGSPFFVIKTEGKEPGKATIEETAIATASFSRAWKMGLGTLDVFHVKPEQVSKEAQSGEFMPKGAFMIRGKTLYHHPPLGLAIGVTKDGVPMCGPATAIEKHCEKHVKIVQGKMKPSDAAKQLKKKLGTDDLDEMLRILPPGPVELK